MMYLENIMIYLAALLNVVLVIMLVVYTIQNYRGKKPEDTVLSNIKEIKMLLYIMVTFAILIHLKI